MFSRQSLIMNNYKHELSNGKIILQNQIIQINLKKMVIQARDESDICTEDGFNFNQMVVRNKQESTDGAPAYPSPQLTIQKQVVQNEQESKVGAQAYLSPQLVIHQQVVHRQESKVGVPAYVLPQLSVLKKVFQNKQESKVGAPACLRAQLLNQQQENQGQVPKKETKVDHLKKMDEHNQNFLKLIKLNEERLEKILTSTSDLDFSKCICNRPTKHVLCIGCGFLGKGRKAAECYNHPKVTFTQYLTDLEFCPTCKSGRYLIEKNVSPLLEQIIAKNVLPVLEKLCRYKHY